MVDRINGIIGLINQVGTNATGVRSTPPGEAPHYTEPQDRVTLSAQARKKADQNDTGIKNEQDLNSEEKQQVNELKKRDAEVKAHEQAHMAAGGGIVQGGASYQYEHGPDGKMYAVGGEVKIDVSAERTPEATIRKMQQVQRAALAPAQPSGTDRAVAAQAAQVEAQARLEKNEGNNETSESQADQPAAPVNSDAAGATQPNTDPSNPNFIFSYKANLSPTDSRLGKITGNNIDLSV